ncbi:T9SS type A sorting domain-containing protein [Rubrivirga litoralis]|uniref:T9SS type A sorting domain-containing protein n=1 Tax=Rubrivirga litoralis TaxID=3075598 RepID=A0ABU3BMB9_9BACT|nr:T9SS type A sorting domain-containing protein [Rubrivirga sp. F394]MDT0630427.1 T9SS type A sorting domain-containing protein [Rubrivirga sp. F394]
MTPLVTPRTQRALLAPALSLGRLALLAAVMTSAARAQTTVLFEDFEDGAVEYVTSTPEFTDGGSDFFTRTDGSDVDPSYAVTGAGGAFYFAAQDIDGDGGSATQSLTFSGIDISGLADLSFSARFAEDDAANGDEDWDASDYVRVVAQIDGGAAVRVFAIEDQGETNTAPRVDTDLDGVGDGAELTPAFAAFSAAIPGTGSTLDLTITIRLDAGDEDVALDDVAVTGVAAVAPLACTRAAPLSFDVDGSGGPVAPDDFDPTDDGDALGEFAGVRHEGAGGAAVDLSACSFVALDASAGQVTYAAPASGAVAAGGAYVFANEGGDQVLPAQTLPDGPGAFALVERTAAVGDDVAAVLGRVVAAVVYDRDRAVSASVAGGATEAERQAFEQALAAVFDQATPAEADGGLDLAVAAWPNPTRGAATVAFGLAAGGAARVAVYDALGREVAVAADGPFGSGRHVVGLPARALPAGVYVVRVTTEGGVRTARLTVVR